jgi:hypothetical protein
MILTTHALVGAVIGKNVENAWLVMIIAFVSHYFLDSLRHGDYLDIDKKQETKDWMHVAMDIAFGMSIVFLFIAWSEPDLKNIFNILLGSFFSALPDSFSLLYKKFNFKILKKLVEFGEKIHPYKPGSPQAIFIWRNSINDLLVSSIAILILFY